MKMTPRNICADANEKDCNVLDFQGRSNIKKQRARGTWPGSGRELHPA
jgi:hypothetical protein